MKLFCIEMRSNEFNRSLSLLAVSVIPNRCALFVPSFFDTFLAFVEFACIILGTIAAFIDVSGLPAVWVNDHLASLRVNSFISLEL